MDGHYEGPIIFLLGRFVFVVVVGAFLSICTPGCYFNAKLILPSFVTRHRAEGGCKEVAHIWLGPIP